MPRTKKITKDTKKIKSKRTKFNKKPIPKRKPIPKNKKSKRTKRHGRKVGGIRNWGGFLLNPPKSCCSPRIVQSSDGGRWCDLGICRNCKNKCKRYEWFINAKADERTAYWERCGVRDFHFSDRKVR